MYGCQLSVIDGTEIEYKPEENIELPEEFSYMPYMPQVLNQGNHPLCVPSSISAYINWKLNLADGGKKLRDIDSWDMYYSKKVEGEGMTFKEAFKYAKETGVDVSGQDNRFYIDKYAKIGNIYTLRQAIVSNGPAMCVLPVRNIYGKKDFWADKYGDVQGYHAVSIVGYDKDGLILRNSWGSGYGKNGYAYIPNEDTNKIIELWTILG